MCKSVTDQLITGSSGCRLTWYTMVSNSVFTRALQPASGYFFQMFIIIYYRQGAFFSFSRTLRKHIVILSLGIARKFSWCLFPILNHFESIGFAGSYGPSCWAPCAAVWNCSKTIFSLSLKPGSFLRHLVCWLKQYLRYGAPG